MRLFPVIATCCTVYCTTFSQLPLSCLHCLQENKQVRTSIGRAVAPAPVDDVLAESASSQPPPPNSDLDGSGDSEAEVLPEQAKM
jgi:hypothetical protein